MKRSNKNAVDLRGLNSTTWKRVESLESAWERARRYAADSASSPAETLPGAVTNPKRRTRTPLTAQQVEAIHTTRDRGESVTSISKQFGVYRSTVWEKTRAT